MNAAPGNGYLWASLDAACLTRVEHTAESGSETRATTLLTRALGDAALPYLARVYVSSSASATAVAPEAHVKALASSLRAAGAAVSVVPVVALADNALVHIAVHFSQPPELA